MSARYDDLADSHILVVGATSGIGRAMAATLAAQGARLLLTGRSGEALDQLVADLPEGRHQWIRADMEQPETLQEIATSARDLDGMVFCPGLISPFPVKYLAKDGREPLMRVNFDSAVELVSLLLAGRCFRRGASLVFMSSVSSAFAHRGGAMYSASKAALEAFCRSIALEQSALGIRANCIQAGMVRTAMHDLSSRLVSPEAMASHEARYPLGIGESGDVANAGLFLLSRASRWITGTSLVVDGGVTLSLD